MRTLPTTLFLISCVCSYSFAKSGSFPANKIGLNLIQISNNHAGMGVYFEQSIDARGRLSYTLPFSIGWDTQNSSDFGTTNAFQHKTALFVNPGLKFYPAGYSRKMLNYALGLSCFYHTGSASGVYGNNFTNASATDYQFSTGGILINNYLGFNVNHVVSFGFEFGIGPTYFNNYKEKISGTLVKAGTNAMANLAFQIAYKF